jgi:hypothetical protein
MKNTPINYSNITAHVSGTYPLRERSSDERDDLAYIVHFPRGFETLDIAVYGHGLCASDAIEAGIEWIKKTAPDAFSPDDEENAFVTR